MSSNFTLSASPAWCWASWSHPQTVLGVSMETIPALRTISFVHITFQVAYLQGRCPDLHLGLFLGAGHFPDWLDGKHHGASPLSTACRGPSSSSFIVCSTTRYGAAYFHLPLCIEPSTSYVWSRPTFLSRILCCVCMCVVCICVYVYVIVCCTCALVY